MHPSSSNQSQSLSDKARASVKAAPLPAAASDSPVTVAGSEAVVEESLSVSKNDRLTDTSLATSILHFKTSGFDPFGAVGCPIYQTATFRQVRASELFSSMG